MTDHKTDDIRREIRMIAEALCRDNDWETAEAAMERVKELIRDVLDVVKPPIVVTGDLKEANAGRTHMELKIKELGL